MTNEAQEFIFSISWIGGVIFAGSLITLIFGFLALATYNRVTEKKVHKKLWDEKIRQNGRAKIAERKHW